MTGEALVSRLDGVKQTGKGWAAKCPAHEDRDPSLSVREGDRGILLRCWAGCTLESICKALGITQCDLFYGALDTDRETIRQRQAERQQREARKKRTQYSHGLTTDTRREAEKFLKHCRGLDPSTLSPENFDSILNTVCDALTVLMEEEITYVHG